MTAKQIQKEQKRIKEMLNKLSDVMVTADADDWAYYLEYSDEDLLNALQIFLHVAKDIAIKAGHYKDESECIRKIADFRTEIKVAFGFDTWELAEKVLGTEE